MDSLVVGTVEIGCIIAPNCHQHRQEAPKRYPAMPVWLLHFVAVGWASGCQSVTDVEGTEMCFHVPATSSEAQSANRRCYRDMEAHFCAPMSTAGGWMLIGD
jgi:hypothetical protein